MRALKYHGGVKKEDLNNENLEALRLGMPNLIQHIENIKNVYGLPCVVAINAFPTDTSKELDLIEQMCNEIGVIVTLSVVWALGCEGGKALAAEVGRLCDEPKSFTYSYDTSLGIEEKVNAIARKIYHADSAVFTAKAKKQIEAINALGYDKLPVCIAKTQYSFSDNPALICAPKGFDITVRELKISAGAEFVVALTGDILTMPGLPKHPAAERIDVDENGKISGLF